MSNSRGSNKEAVIRCVYYLLALYEGPRTITNLLEVIAENDLKEVSRRTVQREMKALDGHFGVYRDEYSIDTWRMDQTDFERMLEMQDSVALALVVAERHLDHIGPDSVIEPARKLFARAKRQLQARDTPAAKWLQRVVVESASHRLQAPQINKRMHEFVLDTALRQVVIMLDYCRHKGEPPEPLTVTSLSMFYRGNVPYLICRDHSDDRIRQLPLSRIDNVRESIVSAARVQDFDLDAYAATGALAFRFGEPFRLQLEVFQSVRREIEDAPLGQNQYLGEIPGRPDLMLVEVTVPYTLNLVQWLMARAPYLKVLGPADFRESFYEELRRGLANGAHDHVEVPKERSF